MDFKPSFKFEGIVKMNAVLELLDLFKIEYSGALSSILKRKNDDFWHENIRNVEEEIDENVHLLKGKENGYDVIFQYLDNLIEQFQELRSFNEEKSYHYKTRIEHSASSEKEILEKQQSFIYETEHRIVSKRARLFQEQWENEDKIKEKGPLTLRERTVILRLLQDAGLLLFKEDQSNSQLEVIRLFTLILRTDNASATKAYQKAGRYLQGIRLKPGERLVASKCLQKIKNVELASIKMPKVKEIIERRILSLELSSKE